MMARIRSTIRARGERVASALAGRGERVLPALARIRSTIRARGERVASALAGRMVTADFTRTTMVYPVADALSERIAELWEGRDSLDAGDTEALTIVKEAVGLLDVGKARVAEIDVATGEVVVHQWLKQAILLTFRLMSMDTVELGPFEFADRIPLKHGYAEAGVRVVPGASARWGSFLAPGVVMMPSYVNIGAWVGSDSMVDTWATVGSCAQIGERVHLAGGVGIGGVLEPPQAVPVVIEDDAMILSRCMITEGARVGQGAVVGAGTIVNPSIPVIDAETGEETSRGRIPPWCVAVTASRRRDFPGGEFFLPCVLVIRHLTEGERHDKAQLNDILRGHGVAT